MLSSSYREHSDIAYQRPEHLFQQLRVMLNSIKRTDNEQDPVDPFIELDRWLELLLVLNEFNALEPANKHHIYYQLHPAMWNWIVNLWNKRHRALAYFICKVYRHYAIEAHDREYIKQSRYLIEGSYK